MVRFSSKYVCQQCEYESTKWFGKCPDCGEWNTAVETVVQTESKRQAVKGKSRSDSNVVEPVLLSSIQSKETQRISTRISELDRVLGGGLVPGQVVLIAGEPGIGKSTLLLQVADMLGSKPETSHDVLYASGEESPRQIKIRSDRMGVQSKNIKISETTDIDEVIELGSKLINDKNGKPLFLIVDSIQTMSTSDLSGMPGSVGQVRECAYRLVRFGKTHNVPVFIVGHVTKVGTVAGPSVLAHIVDTVLWFEGDKNLMLRLLRAVKNRFGPTDEVGVFVMEDKGLISQNNPEKLFVGKTGSVPGSVTTVVLQGTRPILAEIEALVVPTKMPFAKRVVQGIDPKRVELLLAVLQRRCGLMLSDQDVFVSVTGGISIKGDPSADLAICLSIASAYFDKPVSNKLLAVGEVGLLGDIKPVSMQEKRIKEAKRLGYKTIISDKESNLLINIINEMLR
jgi:DNA repair protein RadA/Sms